MTAFLILAFLFCMGSLAGWCIEVVFRKFFSSSNPEHKWINPGFLTGPYTPLYGTGLVILFLLASLETKLPFQDPVLAKAVLFFVMAVCMTVVEYIAGRLCIDLAHVRLWDYSDCRGNIQGIICPLFSFFWAVLGAVYYFLIHPHILDALSWLASNLAFSFFIGLFYGVFLVDLGHTTKVAVIIRKFADEKQIVIRYDDLKRRIREHNAAVLIRARFWFDLHTDKPLREMLADYYEHHLTHVSHIKDSLGRQIPRK